MKEQNPSHAVILCVCVYVCVCVCVCVCARSVYTVYYLPALSHRLCSYNVQVLGNSSALILAKSSIFSSELEGQCGLILSGILCGGAPGGALLSASFGTSSRGILWVLCA